MESSGNKFIDTIVEYEGCDKSKNHNCIFDEEIIKSMYFGQLVMYYKTLKVKKLDLLIRISRFKSNARFDRLHMIQLCFELAHMACVGMDPDYDLTLENVFLRSIKQWKEIEEEYEFKHYPIISESGLYTYDEFMYAYSYRIVLLGVPYLPTSYHDKKNSCPYYFLKHDIVHSDTIGLNEITTEENVSLIRRVFFRIKNSELSESTKEIMIFFMWYLTHEIYTKFSDFFRNIHDVTNIYEILQENSSLHDDYGVYNENIPNYKLPEEIFGYRSSEYPIFRNVYEMYENNPLDALNNPEEIERNIIKNWLVLFHAIKLFQDYKRLFY